MKKVNLKDVQEANDSSRLQPGGYICKYTKVEDVPAKEYLYMEYDIAKGEFEGYYQSLSDKYGFWGGRCYRSYKEKALPMFKRMCSAVSKSNNGYIFDGETNADESTLVGKLVGLVICEEEYVGNDGNIKTRFYVDRECSVEDIVNNNFKVKPLKKLSDEERAEVEGPSEDFVAVPESADGKDDLPF